MGYAREMNRAVRRLNCASETVSTVGQSMLVGRLWKSTCLRSIEIASPSDSELQFEC